MGILSLAEAIILRWICGTGSQNWPAIKLAGLFVSMANFGVSGEGLEAGERRAGNSLALPS